MATSTATVWSFDFPCPEQPESGWRVLTEFGGTGAETAARAHLKSIRWRVAYGELFAVTTDGKQPLPVNPDCFPY